MKIHVWLACLSALLLAGTATAKPVLLDADRLDQAVLKHGPELAEARIRLRLTDLEIELARRPAAPMLDWRLKAGGLLDLEAMLLQPLAELLTRELRTQQADIARERALATYADEAIRALIAARGDWHAAIVAEQTLALAQAQARLAQDEQAWQQQRQANGEGSTEALLQASARAREAQQQVEEAQAERASRRAALAERIGADDAKHLRLPVDLPPALQATADAPVEAPVVRGARLELRAAELETLLRRHAGATWMPALGLDGGGMETSLRLQFKPPLWARARLGREAGEAQQALAEVGLRNLLRRQALALAAALRGLEAGRQAEDQAEVRHLVLAQQLALAEARQAAGETGPEAVWQARSARIEAEQARWEAHQATLTAALEVAEALGVMPPEAASNPDRT